MNFPKALCDAWKQSKYDGAIYKSQITRGDHDKASSNRTYWMSAEALYEGAEQRVPLI